MSKRVSSALNKIESSELCRNFAATGRLWGDHIAKGYYTMRKPSAAAFMFSAYLVVPPLVVPSLAYAQGGGGAGGGSGAGSSAAGGVGGAGAPGAAGAPSP